MAGCREAAALETATPGGWARRPRCEKRESPFAASRLSRRNEASRRAHARAMWACAVAALWRRAGRGKEAMAADAEAGSAGSGSGREWGGGVLTGLADNPGFGKKNVVFL